MNQDKPNFDKPFFNEIYGKKIQIIKKVEMDKKARLKWNKWQRPFRRFVCKTIPPAVRLLPTLQVTSKEKLAQWVYDQVGYGYLYLIGWRKSPKKHLHGKIGRFRLCTIEILPSKNLAKEFEANYIDIAPIRRFHWFESEKKPKYIERVLEKKREARKRMKERREKNTPYEFKHKKN